MVHDPDILFILMYTLWRHFSKCFDILMYDVQPSICLCRHCARSAKRILALSHQLCQHCTGRPVCLILLSPFSHPPPLCRHLLPPSSHLLSNLITTSHSPSHLSTWSAPSDSSQTTALRPADQYSGSRIETLHIHTLNHPHFVYFCAHIKATISQSNHSIRICLLRSG